MRNIKTIVAFLLLAALTSCSEKEKDHSQTPKTLQVQVALANQFSEKGVVSASGKTESVNSANLSTRIMGYVDGIHVKTGQPVKTGQLLITINNADILARKAQAEAAFSQATAGYNNAKKDYERFVILYNQQSASQKEMDDMSTRFEAAKATLETYRQSINEAKAQFAYTNITAPFSGTITNTYVKEGNMANPGMPLISIEGNSGLQVVAGVTEADISSLKTGMPARVLVKSINRELTGVVAEVSNSSQNSGGLFLIKIHLDNPGKEIFSGMYVNVTIPLEKENNPQSEKILVNDKALVHLGQLTGIYAIGSDSTAILRWLRLGKKSGENVEVLSGLSTGEMYVLSAKGKLHNGVKVTY